MSRDGRRRRCPESRPRAVFRDGVVPRLRTGWGRRPGRLLAAHRPVHADRDRGCRCVGQSVVPASSLYNVAGTLHFGRVPTHETLPSRCRPPRLLPSHQRLRHRHCSERTDPRVAGKHDDADATRAVARARARARARVCVRPVLRPPHVWGRRLRRPVRDVQERNDLRARGLRASGLRHERRSGDGDRPWRHDGLRRRSGCLHRLERGPAGGPRHVALGPGRHERQRLERRLERKCGRDGWSGWNEWLRWRLGRRDGVARQLGRLHVVARQLGRRLGRQRLERPQAAPQGAPSAVS